MANVVYKLSAKVDKVTGKSEIHVRSYAGRGLDYRAKTNLYVQKEYWNEKAGTVKIPTTRSNTLEKQELIKSLSELSTELATLSKDIREAFLIVGNEKSSPDWLATFIQERNEARLPASKPAEDEVEESEIDGTEEFFKVFERFVSIQKISEIRKRHYNVIIRALKRFALYNVQEVSFATLSSDMLREFAAFLETEHEFVVTDDKGNPCIKDPLYLEAYNAVPECRLPKQRGENTIIGTMSRFHTFIRWAKKNKYITEDPYDDYVIGTAIYGTPFYLTTYSGA